MSAARYYEPDEPFAAYEPDDEPPANLAWMDRVLKERAQETSAQEKFETATICILPSVRVASLAQMPHPPAALRAVSDLESLAKEVEDEMCLDLALRLKVVCKMMRAEWSEERIAKVRPQLAETARAIRALMKTDRCKRGFNPLQHLLFDDE